MNEKIDLLDNINWNFDFKNEYLYDRAQPINCRKYFSYPATFIPEIPYTLIEILSEPGECILDPFGGIGTTFFQAVIQDREAYSIDNNLVASEINRSMAFIFNSFYELDKVQEKILKFCADYKKNNDYTKDISGEQTQLREWYAEETYNQIAYLISKYNVTREKLGEIEYHVFKICLADILTTASSQNGGWAYIADNVKPKKNKLKEKRAIERFNFCVKRIVEDFLKYREVLQKKGGNLYLKSIQDNHILNQNFVQMEVSDLKGKVDLVVTSPPYPKMIDYVKSQRLVYYLLDKEFKQNLEEEIGARYKRTKRDTLDQYLAAMKECNSKLANIIKDGGYLCYILPDYPVESDDTKDSRRQIIEKVVEDCKQKGFHEEKEIHRYIPGTKRSNNMKWASLKNEKIWIFKRVKHEI